MTHKEAAKWSPFVLAGTVTTLVVVWALLGGQERLGALVIALVMGWSLVTGEILARIDWSDDGPLHNHGPE